MADSPVITSSRANSWLGPRSTWHSHTKDERSTVSALDTLRAQDLGIQLYNAYAIKARVRRASSRRGKKGEAKSTSTSTAGDDEGGKEFVPPDVWTAWPMPAEQVPREPVLPNVGGRGAWRRREDVRPSAGLEEALLATATRLARERWSAREWESDDGKEMEGDEVGEATAAEKVSEQSEDEEEVVEPGRLMFSSQTLGTLGKVSSSTEEIGKAESTEGVVDIKQRPVPLADDDRARQLLLPSIRHIISKADDLLEGLRKAHEAYATKWNKSKADDAVTGDDTDTGAETHRSRARSRNQRSSKRARTSSVNLGTSGNSARSASSRRVPRQKTKHLKLRDWSDVLGMAALTGWDADVVQQAAERCSQLFGEDMLFRTFEEGKGEEQSFFTEQLASGQDLDSSDED